MKAHACQDDLPNVNANFVEHNSVCTKDYKTVFQGQERFQGKKLHLPHLNKR